MIYANNFNKLHVIMYKIHKNYLSQYLISRMVDTLTSNILFPYKIKFWFSFERRISQLLNRICWNYQFSHSVVSDSLRSHESQHARPPCPSPTPRVHPDSRPLSQWCHPTISFSVVPFSSCPQSLPASESFPMSQLFT